MIGHTHRDTCQLFVVCIFPSPTQTSVTGMLSKQSGPLMRLW